MISTQDMGTIVMGKVESGGVMKGASLILMPNKVRRNMNTVYQETFEEENFRKFRAFGTIHKSFLREFRGACTCAPSTRY